MAANHGALQEKHADAIDRMYEVAGLNLKTATEAEKGALLLLRRTEHGGGHAGSTIAAGAY